MTLQDLKPGELLELRIIGMHAICKFLSYCKRPAHIHVEVTQVLFGNVKVGREACIPITKYMARYNPPGDVQVILSSEDQRLADKLILALEKQLFDYHINKALDNGDKSKFLELVRGMQDGTFRAH